MARDILQHHDGVIHYKPGGNRQRHQRQVVKTKPTQVHGGKGAYQRYRNRHRRDQRGAPRAQEQEHHQDHQRDGDDQRLLYLLKRGADGRGAVLRNLEVDGRRNRFLELRQARADAVHRLDNVGFRQFADHQQNRRFGVSHPGVAHVLHRIGDAGDVAQAHRRTVVVVNNQRLILGGGFQLVVGLDLPAVAAVLNRTLRLTHVGVADSGSHVVKRHALIKQRLRIQPHAHGGQGAAADVHVAHAVNLGDGLRQLGGGKIVQLALGVGL